MRKKYWNPDCEPELKTDFDRLLEKVDKARAKEGKPKFKTSGQFIAALVRVGNANREDLIEL